MEREAVCPENEAHHDAQDESNECINSDHIVTKLFDEDSMIARNDSSGKKAAISGESVEAGQVATSPNKEHPPTSSNKENGECGNTATKML